MANGSCHTSSVDFLGTGLSASKSSLVYLGRYDRQTGLIEDLVSKGLIFSFGGYRQRFKEWFDLIDNSVTYSFVVLYLLERLWWKRTGVGHHFIYILEMFFIAGFYRAGCLSSMRFHSTRPSIWHAYSPAGSELVVSWENNCLRPAVELFGQDHWF